MAELSDKWTEELGPVHSLTNVLILTEAIKCGIEYQVVSKAHGIVLLKHNGIELLIRQSRLPTTSGLVSYICDYKGAAQDVLDFYGFSVPRNFTIDLSGSVRKLSDDDPRSIWMQVKTYAELLGFPVVVKPEAEAHGRGVTADIKDLNTLQEAVAFALPECLKSSKLMIQQYIPGHDYRILIVNFKVVAVAKRLPAQVVGDGILTVRQLIQKENENPLRRPGHSSPLSTIVIDLEVERILLAASLSLDDIPSKDQIVVLRKNANLSTGGLAIDTTDDLPAENILLFEQMAQKCNASVLGIDVRCHDISKPLSNTDYAVIELNVSPGIRMHHFPSQGKPRNVARQILNILFPHLS